MRRTVTVAATMVAIVAALGVILVTVRAESEAPPAATPDGGEAVTLQTGEASEQGGGVATGRDDDMALSEVAMPASAIVQGVHAAHDALMAAVDESKTGCLRCHAGIESIREPESEMMKEILALGESRGDPDGCIVCHGGDPKATEKEAAHGGKAFYADPGSPWVNKKTCGICHPDQVGTQWHSLMMTQAGIIQGMTWAFGAMTGYEHKWANYDVKNPADPHSRLGTEAYRKYMERLSGLNPQVYVEQHEQVPPGPTDLAELTEHPERAAFTYLRNQCLRCHLAVQGRQTRGDYRGMGCSSCHIPYGNQGYYEGDDRTIPRGEPGHGLVHAMQATREAKVVVDGHAYSGIPIETCTTCHDRGKRIGVSFQGLMEMPYKSPYTKDGKGQPALHTKHYLAMRQDVHYQKGMICQDCHTTLDVHSDGFLAACTLAAVEIECSDCHGTPTAFPWELPLGFMDEFEETPATGPPRETTTALLPQSAQGKVYPARDGYLLTTRGNPFGNVVRDGNKVIVHTAAGKDIELKPLKLIDQEKKLSDEGRVAMKAVQGHLERMECYTCHAAWAPQCYGCHAKIDYSAGKESFDWLAAGHRHMRPECKGQGGEAGYDTTMPGQIEEQRSFLRWENPPLAVNGEGRITPAIPGCQVSATVIGPDGKPIILNHIYHTRPNCEGAGAEGQLSIDMSPVQPHTQRKEARKCESCHADAKALGYGIDGGSLMRPPDEEVIADLETADGHILPQDYEVQIAAIKGLKADWSQFVNAKGEQTQTVGHHLKGSRPLNDKERALIDRQGVCLACHKEIPSESLAVSLLHHVAYHTGQLPETTKKHNTLLNKILLLSAWGQVAAVACVPLVAIVIGVWYWRRRRVRKKA